MATKFSFIEFLSEQIRDAGIVTNKKMFGEYMIYCNGKPVFLVCDDTLFVKILPETGRLIGNGRTGCPYNGAKAHYIVDDVDDAMKLTALASALEKVLPFPKKKSKT